jgi:hypothetical protein
MGDLIQNGVTQSDYSVTGVVLATSTSGLLAVLTSYLVFRSTRPSASSKASLSSSSRTGR